MQADTLYQAYQGAWRRVLDRLRLEVDDDAFKFWLQDLELQQVKGGNLHVTLIAPTLALQYWATTHYADRLLALWQETMNE